MDTVIQTYDLSKQYGMQRAVDEMNLTVRKGEIYGFLGRNGAGKTTTIRMLLGLVKPTGGEIEIFGKDFFSDRHSILRRIGSTIETPGFYPELTAFENLKINAKLIGIHDSKAIEESLETVGLLDERKKLVKNYSLGMKQRLGIARAILHAPELLILDEPTNGLDPAGIKEIRKLIKVLAEKRQITIFMSSHILSEVQQIATTIGIIHEGKLLEEISLDDLRKRNRKYIEIKVTNEGKAVMLLEKDMQIFDYEVHEEGSLRIYTRLEEISQINRLFVQNGIDVAKLTLSEDNLEDYFLNLTGGEVVD
ncbi:MAG: ABC transporter ATP-binding protein [Bacillota bacterium]